MKDNKLTTLKFNDPLVAMVLRKTKDTTWRIGDDKNIDIGEIVSLCRNSGEEFGKGEVRSIKKTLFKYLSLEDKTGHERFETAEDMYKTYSIYYGFEVCPKTEVQVIKYKLLD